MKTVEYKAAVQSKVSEYLRTGNTEAAGDAFELLKTYEWKRKSYRTAQMIYGTADDANSLYANKFMDALAKYDESKGDFINFVNRSITNAVNTTGLKNSKIRKTEVEYGFSPTGGASDDSENMNPEDKFSDPEQLEIHDQAFDMPYAEKQRIMREIVQDIMEKASEEELGMLVAYSETNSMREVARQFDTNQVRVMRAIDRMKKYYDFAKYGDVAQYFTTNTTRTRGGAKK